VIALFPDLFALSVQSAHFFAATLASMNHSAELTVAARRIAMSALEELNRLGVDVAVDKAGKARFRGVRVPPPAAKLTRTT
jgi:hypothetical protein